MNGASIGPIRCQGFNKNGELIATCDAIDARKHDINPYTVQAAVSAAINEAEDQVRNIILDLYRIYSNGSMILNDVDLTKPEDDMEQAIQSIPEYISKNLDSLVNDAEKVRNSLQSQYNEAAKSNMRQAQRVKHEDDQFDIVSVRYIDLGGSN